MPTKFIRLANAIDNIRYDVGQEGATILWENVPKSCPRQCLRNFLGEDYVEVIHPSTQQREGWSSFGVWFMGAKDDRLAGLGRPILRIGTSEEGGSLCFSSGARRWDCANALLPICPKHVVES